MNYPSEYARHGMALIGIPPDKKGPVASGWNLRERAITKPEKAALLKGNVGLLHAHCRPLPTMAMDIDDQVEAHSWLANRGIDLAALLDDSDAVQIVSGRIGRAKLIYTLPVGTAPIRTAQVKSSVGTMVLEFRCAAANGTSVQDVLPPSTHPETGKQYRWGGKGDWRNIPTIPECLLQVWSTELLKQSKGATTPRGALQFFRGVEDTPRQRARISAALQFVSADCSYDVYRDITWAILSLGWHDSEAIAENWCRSAPYRFNSVSFAAVIGCYNERLTPTVGTIIHYARLGGWNG